MRIESVRVKQNFCSIKSSLKEAKQKQDEKIIQNLNTTWPREKCNTGFMMLSAALLDCFITAPISKAIYRNTNTKIHPLSLNAAVGIGVLAIGAIGSYVLNKIDGEKNTKLGNFAYKLFNGPKAKIENQG